jgi:UDP-3-O-[3-hydroxymyristoyl] N-acetylglucosamine deacetylase
MVLRPAPADSGICFTFRDRRKGRASLRADWRHAVATPLCSTLEHPETGARVRTVEHLLAAFAMAEIDNAAVELDGDEVPIVDGGAGPLLALVDRAGAANQDSWRRYLRVVKPLDIRDGPSRARILPSDAPSLEITLPLDEFGVLTYRAELSPAILRREIAAARTFGWFPQALPGVLFGRFMDPPLLRGASLRTALVMAGRRAVNRRALAIPDELVRHRALDAYGDLALVGAPVLADIRVRGPRHRFMALVLRTLFADETAWCWTDEAPAEAGPDRMTGGPGESAA